MDSAPRRKRWPSLFISTQSEGTAPAPRVVVEVPAGGASCLASSRTDGVDWAFTINTRDWPPSATPTLNDLENSINRLLDRLPMIH
jgi:hypothetical protein